MSFPFIPRTVAKRNGPQNATVKVKATLGSLPTTSQPNASSKGKEKAPEGPAAEECAILFGLALSEYALWMDSDLRMKLSEEDGYVSLHHLLYHCQVLAPLSNLSQTLLVKHLKAHLSEVLDFRMLVTEPKPWFSRSGEASSQQTVRGGYEVRLKTPPTSTLSKAEWEKRMVYVENVPIHYRSVSALVKFLLALLPSQDETPIFSRIQNVYLPPHHQDKPGDPPTFKGFAVVTFIHESDTRHVLDSWPWHPHSNTSGPKLDGCEKSDIGEAANDARKFGFRTTSKSTWEALRAEYLVYRQQLVEEINAYQDSEAPAPAASSSRVTSTSVAPASPSETKSVQQAPLKRPYDESSATQVITLSSPYPYGCLLFIKNIHPEANKTTLKSLFSKVLSNNANISGGIDYVDFNKGMDTCYLRLGTPSSASLLSAHFTSNPTAQVNGLDDTGSPASEAVKEKGKPIAVEVVLGTREDVYWQKVPEKIRRGAVEKAVQLQSSGGDAKESSAKGGGEEAQGGGDDKRSRKRRKR